MIIDENNVGIRIDKYLTDNTEYTRSKIQKMIDNGNILVNGKEVKGQEEQTVADYLEENGYRMNRIAVELNGEILPKYKYSETRLKDGDSMEIVTFVGGG